MKLEPPRGRSISPQYPGGPVVEQRHGEEHDHATDDSGCGLPEDDGGELVEQDVRPVYLGLFGL